jgi:hypothetical protein
MASDQSGSAPDAEPNRPKRIWDGETWVEAMTIRRTDDGKFARKNGHEPIAQLLLFGKDAA